MGYMLKTNTTWGPMYYSDSIEGTVDKKKAAVFDSEDEARKFLKTFDWLILKDIKHDKVEIVKESTQMKSFRKFVEDSKQYKIVVFGKNDGDDREYFIDKEVRDIKPTESQLQYIFDHQYEKYFKKYDNVLMKVTDMSELTVYSSVIF